MILKKAKGLVCIFLVIIFVLSASSCSYLREFYDKNGDVTTTEAVTTTPGADTTETPEDTTTADGTAVTFPIPEIEMDFINPYTGLPCKYDLTKSRAVAFVVDNSYLSAPQDGIAKADILCEVIGNDGDTVLLAVCKNPEDASRMGPLGTANKVLLDLAKCFDALTFSRDMTQSMKDSQSAPSYLYTYEGSSLPFGFFEASDRKNEMGYKYSVMGEGARLFSLVSSMGTSVSSNEAFSNLFNFYTGDREYSLAGRTSSGVYIEASEKQHIQFVYSESSKMYYRYHFGTEPHTDATNDGAVAFKNLFLLSGTDNYTLAEDEIKLTVGGRGNGFYVCNGKYISISWVRDSVGVFKFYKTDGTELEVPAGKSYMGFFSPSKLSGILLNGK